MFPFGICGKMEASAILNDATPCLYPYATEQCRVLAPCVFTAVHPFGRGGRGGGGGSCAISFLLLGENRVDTDIVANG